MKREEKKLSKTFKDASYGEHTSDDWSKYGFTHQDALKWKKAGFTPQEAKSFRDEGFTPNKAKEWKEQGFTFEEVKLLKDLNINPHENKELIKTIKVYESSVNSIALSPDGKLLAFGDKDGIIQIWNIDNNKKIKTFKGSDSANSLAFSPDGESLAVGTNKGDVIIYSIYNDEVIEIFKEDQDSSPINLLAFSPDGELLATGTNKGDIIIYDIYNDRVILEIQASEVDDDEEDEFLDEEDELLEESVSSLAFSPDGELLATGTNKGDIIIYNIYNGVEIEILGEDQDPSPINSLAFSPDGKLLAAGTHEGSIIIYNMYSDEVIEIFEEDQDSSPIDLLAFSPDGELLAFSINGKAIKIWRVETDLDYIEKLKSDLDYIKKLKSKGYSLKDIIELRKKDFSADNIEMVIKWINTCKSYNIPPIEEYLKIKENVIKTYPNATSLEIFEILSLIDNFEDAIQFMNEYFQFWKKEGFDPIQTKELKEEGFTFEEIKLLNDLNINPYESKGLIQTLEGHSDSVEVLAFSPDGKLLASSSNDAVIKIWDVNSGDLVKTLEGHSDSVEVLAFSPDGKFLVSGSNDKTIKIWDVNNGKVVKTLEGLSFVRSVVFLPDERLLAVNERGETIEIWDVYSSKVIKTLDGHSDYLSSIVFSPDGKLLACGSWYKNIKIWDVNNGNLVGTFDKDETFINSLAFSPDGKFLAAGTHEGIIRYPDSTGLSKIPAGDAIYILDVDKNKIVKTLEEYANSVISIAFSPDGEFLASVVYIHDYEHCTYRITIWNINSEESIKIYERDINFKSLVFSPDGKFLAAGSYSGTIKIWKVRTDFDYIKMLKSKGFNIKDIIKLIERGASIPKLIASNITAEE